MEDAEATYGIDPHTVWCVLSGKARGVDTLGEAWAKDHNIPIEEFPAMWHTDGRGAGHVRNEKMAKKADALVAISEAQYDGGISKGTKDMIQRARRHGLRTYVYVVHLGTRLYAIDDATNPNSIRRL